jgi:acyl-CoA reductase-like NAD-dependent aldehyde dehydrogenase
MAKGYRMPASPEYRRMCSREAAAHKRAYLLWLKDPVAQAERTERYALYAADTRRRKRLETQDKIKETAAHIRFFMGSLRRLRAQGRPEVVQKLYVERLQRLWRDRRWLFAELCNLEVHTKPTPSPRGGSA